jgi:transcriptional regulator with XRE-family HTH domain
MPIISELKDYKTRHNLTHTALAKQLNVSSGILWKWLDKGANPSPESIEKINALLDKDFKPLSLPLEMLQKIEQNQPELKGLIIDLIKETSKRKIGNLESKLARKVLDKGDYLSLEEMYKMRRVSEGKEWDM